MSRKQHESQQPAPDALDASRAMALANHLASVLLNILHLHAESDADTLAQIRDLALTECSKVGVRPELLTTPQFVAQHHESLPNNLHTLTDRPVPDGWEVSTNPAWLAQRATTSEHPEQVQAYEGPEGLVVIEELRAYQHADGQMRPWHHISISRPDRLPSWRDLKIIKGVWFGNDVTAYQVLATESEHFNYHPFCLHLWHLPGQPDLIPNFAAQNGGRV